MQGELAALLLNGALLTVGLGALLAAGVLEPTLRSVLAGAGLAYLAGFGIVLLTLTLTLVLGLPFGLPAFAAVALALALSAGALALRRHGLPARPSSPRRPRLPRTPDGWAVVVFVVVFGAYALIGLASAAVTPLDQWDAWSIWTRKAVMLHYFDGLRAEFFESPAYEFMHQDYPLVLPMFEALHFRAAGTVNTQAVHAPLWGLLIAFGWAAAYLGSRLTRPLVWAPLVLAACLAPGVYGQLLTAYADIPMALFLGLGVLLVGMWLTDGRRQDLLLGALFLATAASIKNEGLSAAAAVLGAAAVVVAASRRVADLREFALGAAAFVVAVLPWRVWTAVNEIESDVPIGKALDPGHMLDRTERIWPAVKGLHGQLADQGTWFYLLPLGAAIAVGCVITGAVRRVAAYYLIAGASFFALLVVVYWVTSNDLAFYLETSQNRVVDGLQFIAFAAILHLAATIERRSAAQLAAGTNQ